jgi:hypothetical protein
MSGRQAVEPVPELAGVPLTARHRGKGTKQQEHAEPATQCAPFGPVEACGVTVLAAPEMAACIAITFIRPPGAATKVQHGRPNRPYFAFTG